MGHIQVYELTVENYTAFLIQDLIVSNFPILNAWHHLSVRGLNPYNFTAEPVIQKPRI